MKLDIVKIKVIVFATLLLFLLLLVLQDSLITQRNQREFFKNANYSYISLLRDKQSENTYYFSNDKYAFYVNNSESNMNIISLMEIDVNYDQKGFVCLDCIGLEQYNKLENHEIAISLNLADMYSLEIGDTINSTNVVNSELRQYTIKYIFNETYTLIDSSIDKNRGVIILPLELDFIENVESKYIYFSSENPSHQIINEGNQLYKLISVEDIERDINNLYYSRLSVFGSGLFIILLLSLSLYFRECNSHYYNVALSGDRRRLMKMLLVNQFIIILTILFLVSMLSIIISFISFNSLHTFIIGVSGIIGVIFFILAVIISFKIYLRV